MPLNYRKIYLDSPDITAPKQYGDAGFDLCAYGNYVVDPVTTNHNVISVRLGVAVEIPFGSVGLILPRSGLRKTYKITTFGTGVIDSGYRGELEVLIANHGTQPFAISHGDRICQLVIMNLNMPSYVEGVQEMEQLSDTTRGNKGFGSTGI